MSFEGLPKYIKQEIFFYLDVESFFRCKRLNKGIKGTIEQQVAANPGIKQFFDFLTQHNSSKKNEVTSSKKNEVTLFTKNIFVFQLTPSSIVTCGKQIFEKLNLFIQKNLTSCNSVIKFDIYFPSVRCVDLECKKGPHCTGMVRINRGDTSTDLVKWKEKDFQAKMTLFFLNSLKDVVSSGEEASEQTFLDTYQDYKFNTLLETCLQTPLTLEDDHSHKRKRDEHEEESLDSYDECLELINRIHPIVDDIHYKTRKFLEEAIKKINN